jgi:hypothetical protein
VPQDAPGTPPPAPGLTPWPHRRPFRALGFCGPPTRGSRACGASTPGYTPEPRRGSPCGHLRKTHRGVGRSDGESIPGPGFSRHEATPRRWLSSCPDGRTSGGERLPNGYSPVPSRETPLPNGDAPLPTGNGLLPAGERSLPSGDGPLPARPSAVPSRETSLPGGYRRLPTRIGLSPTWYGVAQANARARRVARLDQGLVRPFPAARSSTNGVGFIFAMHEVSSPWTLARRGMSGRSRPGSRRKSHGARRGSPGRGCSGGSRWSGGRSPGA